MHNIFPTNSSLFKMKIKESPFCSHCNNSIVDTIDHFFVSCTKIHLVWREIALDILSFMNLNIHFNAEIILVGATDIPNVSRPQLGQLNRVISVGRHSISKYKADPGRTIQDVYRCEADIRNLWGNKVSGRTD